MLIVSQNIAFGKRHEYQYRWQLSKHVVIVATVHIFRYVIEVYPYQDNYPLLERGNTFLLHNCIYEYNNSRKCLYIQTDFS